MGAHIRFCAYIAVLISVHQVAVRTNLIPHYIVAVGVHEVVLRIRVEVARARICICAAILNGKIPVTVNREVERVAGILRRRCSIEDIDRAKLYAKADLLRVGTAVVRRRRRSRGDCLTVYILKYHAAGLKPGRVDVGNVIADHVHLGLMGTKSGHAGIQ